MTLRRSIIFHVDLVQDVAVLKPLIALAARVSPADRVLLVSSQFKRLDAGGVWDAEIDRIVTDTGSVRLDYETTLDAYKLLAERRGLIVAGSESSVKNHRLSHDLFRSVPSGFITVALQHGFECLGFLHNRKHSEATGDNILFAANIAVGWFAQEKLVHVAPSEQSKLFVAGPPMLIDRAVPAGDDPDDARCGDFEPYRGVICENMHSVRFSNASSRDAFMTTFNGFAGRISTLGVKTVLRPHPAGRYTQRNGLALPTAVELNDAPLSQIDLTQYSYAISAPSTVLLDFMLDDVPVGVWQGSDGAIDASNFAGLPLLDDLEDWWWLANASVVSRSEMIAAQHRFLSDCQIPVDVTSRYASLLALA